MKIFFVQLDFLVYPMSLYYFNISQNCLYAIIPNSFVLCGCWPALHYSQFYHVELPLSYYMEEE